MARIVVALVVCALSSILLAQSATITSPEARLKAAMQLERVDGNLPGAIKEYQVIITAYSKTHPAVTATALLQLADLYRQIADSRATETYRRIVRDYANHKEAATARTRLAATTGSQIVNTDDRVVWSSDTPEELFECSVSPDGRLVSYTFSDTGELRLRDLRTGRDRTLVKGSETPLDTWVYQSAISRDGRMIAYSFLTGPRDQRRRQLHVRPLSATAATQPRVLVDSDRTVTPYEWSADGKRISVQVYRADRTEVGIIDSSSGDFTFLHAIDRRGSSRVSLSPDGAFLAYDESDASSTVARRLVVVPANDTTRMTVVAEGSRHRVVGWSPNGRALIFLSDRGGRMGLWSQPMTGGRPVGNAERLKQDVYGVPVGITATGQLFYFATTVRQSLQTASIDWRTGTRTSDPQPVAIDPQGVNGAPLWSYDGTSLAYLVARPLLTTNVAMAIQSSKSGVVQQVPIPLGVASYDWSRDGRRFISRAGHFDGRSGLFMIDAADGQTTPVALASGGTGYFYPEFSADDSAITYLKVTQTSRPGESVEIYAERNLRTGIERDLFTMPQRGLRVAGLSPDGRYLAAFTVGNGSRLGVIDTQTGAWRELRNRPGTMFSRHGGLHWLPDSHSFVVIESTKGKNDLWWIPLEGDARQIDLGVTNLLESGIAVHPNGDQIAFAVGEIPSAELRVFTLAAPRGQPAAGRSGR